MTSIASWLFGGHKPSPNVELTLADSASEEEKSPEEALSALLEQYKTTALPATSRFYGDLQTQREFKPPSVLELWRHAWFIASKTKDIVSDIAVYHWSGPRRPSWGLEMTMLAAFMRNMASNTHLVDVPTLRFAMSLGGLIPTPSDALITPVTFRVRRRGLRGLLRKWDELEDGRREVGSEWVVSKRLWMRLQREWKGLQVQQQREQHRELGGDRNAAPRHGSSQSRAAHPNGSSAPHSQHKVKERVVLFLHGGAYYTASAATHRLITISLSKYLDARVFAINYRLAPDTRFPGALHDAVSAYLRLTEDLGVPPGNVIVAGDSAGGGLCVALMMYLRDEGYSVPGAAILMCPWVDLTMSCASWDTNASLDIITFPTDPADHMNPVACYLGPEGMSSFITHPYASPLFGDFTGLPPMLIQGGDCEVLRDEVTLLAHKATLAGVEVVHEIYEDAVHVFQLYPFLEQSRKAFRSCKKFVFETLPAIKARERERDNLSRQGSFADTGALGLSMRPRSLSRTKSFATTDMDVSVEEATPRTAEKGAPVSPPMTPTPSVHRDININVNSNTPSPNVSDEGDLSDDVELDSRVETALEREITGSDLGGPIVVDAYGTEEPRSRPASIIMDLDNDEASSSASGSGASAKDGTADGETGLFGSMSKRWQFRSSKSYNHIPTLSQFQNGGGNDGSGIGVEVSNLRRTSSRSALLVKKSRHGQASAPAPSFSRTPPAQSSTGGGLSGSGSGSGRTSPSQHRNHRRTPSALSITPVSRAPPVPEARRSPVTSTLSLSHSSAPTSTSSSTAHLATPTLRDDRPIGRQRTTSHPDIVQLMQDYAQKGPANATTTYAMQPVQPDSASNGRRSRGASVSGKSAGAAP